MTRRGTYFTQLRTCSQRAWMANTRYGYIFDLKKMNYKAILQNTLLNMLILYKCYLLSFYGVDGHTRLESSVVHHVEHCYG